jgi:hypothetical protein
MKTLGYPQYGSSQKKGRIGEKYLNLFVSRDLGWIFRPTNQEDDFGIDAFIDIIDDSNVTGLTLAAQVKCGESYMKNKSKDGIIYNGQNKHLNYYLNLGCPIILVIFDNDPTIGYWVEFDISKTEKTSKGWMQEIPFKNTIDISVKEYWRSLLPNIEDYSERIETLWRTNKTLDKSTLCSYVIDKKGVEELDFKPLKQLVKQLTRTRQSAVNNRNKHFVTFLDYDNDPREVYEIPEIRRWFKESLNNDIPWFYLLCSDDNGISIMILLYSCCDIKVISKDNSITRVEIRDFIDIECWFNINFNNLNKLTEENNISMEINRDISGLIVSIVQDNLIAKPTS